MILVIGNFEVADYHKSSTLYPTKVLNLCNNIVEIAPRHLFIKPETVYCFVTYACTIHMCPLMVSLPCPNEFYGRSRGTGFCSCIQLGLRRLTIFFSIFSPDMCQSFMNINKILLCSYALAKMINPRPSPRLTCYKKDSLLTCG